VRLARKLDGRAGAVDAFARRHELAVSLGDLEGDGVCDRLRLRHGLADARIGHAQLCHTLASLEQLPLQLDEAYRQVEVTGRVVLPEIEQVSFGDDAGGEVGAGNARAFLSDLDGLAGYAEFATGVYGLLQAISQADGEGRHVGGVHH